MPVSLDHVRPHITLTLFRAADPDAIVQEVVARFEDVALTLPTAPKPLGEDGRMILPLDASAPTGLAVTAARYRIEKPPSWLRVEHAPDFDDEEYGAATTGGEGVQRAPERLADDLLDVANHLIVLVCATPFLALYASHDTMRARLTELVSLGVTGEVGRQVRLAHTATLLEREEVENAFVRGNAKSAWLEGLHVPTILKADRKILSGPDLRYALDQFGDQTYTYSAAISVLPDVKTAADEPLRVGVSYSKSTLWTRSTKNLGEFLIGLQELIGVLTGAQPDAIDVSEYLRAGLPFVARPLSVRLMNDIEDGFDVGYEAPELIEKELVAGQVVDQPKDDDPWQINGRFVVDEAASRKLVSGAEVVADAYFKDRKLATLSLLPVPRSERTLEILHRVSAYHVDKADAEMAALDRSLAKRSTNLTIHYASGHVVQNGGLFQTRFRDAIFERWRWLDLRPAADGVTYKVSAEKPTRPGVSAKGKPIEIFEPSQIGQQRSLFCFVKNNPAMMASPDNTPATDWWLLCDDGAGEIADFIAISLQRPAITFIHVKARHKGEKDTISVTPFSEVVSQAVKNLRAYDQGLLANMLASRTTAANTGLVWRHTGATVMRLDFITALEALRKPQRHVMIFQPRISQTTWDAAIQRHRAGKEGGQVGRMRQLSALLSGAESTFQKLGATFSVVGEAC